LRETLPGAAIADANQPTTNESAFYRLTAMDPYSLCPCGSGKKLKFCCTDLIGEIEKIHRMIEGDQPRAALRHVEQTLATSPGRASLLDLQAMLQMSLGEVDAARATVEEFLKADPTSPSAHAQNAMLLAERGEATQAVEALQSALGYVETNLPQRVLEAIGALGHVLIQHGDIVAARAHLWLYEAIAGDNDHRALELLVRMNQMSDLPLLLRDRLQLKSLPAGHAVAAEMAVIQKLAAVGKWRAAADQCDELLPDYLDQPIFFYNRALLSGYLADRKNFVAGMRLYARQDIAVDDAVEAEAIAQLVDEESGQKSTRTVRTVFDVTDEDTLMEKLTSSEQLANYPMSPEDLENHEGPKPRGQYLLLDRESPKEVADLKRDQVPRIIGFVTYYGRQTDRGERIELLTDSDDSLDSTKQALTQTLGDALGQQTSEEDAGPSPGGDKSLSWRWHFPPQTPPSVRKQLLAEERHVALLDRWPEEPRDVLGDKTPSEAAAIDELRLPLLASLLLLEQGGENAGYDETFGQLRKKLNLPAAEPITAIDEIVGDVPMVRASRMDVTQLSDAGLALLYKRAILVNANVVIAKLIREGLKRPTFASEVPFETLYEQLFSLEPDSDDAAKVIDEARAWATANNQSCGKWDLLELQLYITDNNSEGANRLLGHLRDEHMDEPEIAQQVYQLLYMIGAIPEGGPGAPGPGPGPATMAGGVPSGAAASTSGESGIWTPDSESGGEKSKLWTPD